VDNNLIIVFKNLNMKNFAFYSRKFESKNYEKLMVISFYFASNKKKT